MLSFLLTEEMKPFIVCVDISPFLPSCPLNDDQITMLWRNFIIKNWTDIKQKKKQLMPICYMIMQFNLCLPFPINKQSSNVK